MSRPVTIYSTRWCGYCRRLARRLDDEGIPYVEVDVDQHTEHGRRIIDRTGGYRTVPTVEIAGNLLVNPSVEEVRAALEGSSVA